MCPGGSVLVLPFPAFVQPYGWLLKSPVIECRSSDDCAIQPYLVFPVAVWGILAVILLVTWVGAGWVRAAFRPSSVGFVIFNFLNRRLRSVLLGVILLTGVLAALVIIGPALIVAVPDWLARGTALLKPAAVISAIGSLSSRWAAGCRGDQPAAPVRGGVLVRRRCRARLRAVADQCALRVTTDQMGLSALIAGWVLFYAVSAEWWSIAGFYRAAAPGVRDLPGLRRRRHGEASEQWQRPGEAADRRSELLGGGLISQRLATAHLATARTSTPEVRTLRAAGDERDHQSGHRAGPHPDRRRGWLDGCQVSTGLLESLMFRRAGPADHHAGRRGLRCCRLAGHGGVPDRAASRRVAVANVRPGMDPQSEAAPRLQSLTVSGRWPAQWGEVSAAAAASAEGALRDPRPNDLYIYVTHAGHWENTGLVELIRDRTHRRGGLSRRHDRPQETATRSEKRHRLAKLGTCRRAARPRPLRGPCDGHREPITRRSRWRSD
jgi:hypothetical protein